jgi:hypothetical protein
VIFNIHLSSSFFQRIPEAFGNSACYTASFQTNHEGPARPLIVKSVYRLCSVIVASWDCFFRS